MCKFRCRATNLPTNLPAASTIVYNAEDELCKLCDWRECGNEFHYILRCPFFSNERKKFLKVNKKSINCIQMKSIFNRASISKLKCLANFICVIMKTFSEEKKAKENKSRSCICTQTYNKNRQITQTANCPRFVVFSLTSKSGSETKAAM